MKRFLIFLTTTALIFSLLLCACTSQPFDRSKELKKVMQTCDSKWSQAFPTGSASFREAADYIADWGENAGMKVTKKTKHYIVLTNSSSRGLKKTPSLTIYVSVDPSRLRDSFKMLSMAMTSLLGPFDHGRLRLIVSELRGEDCIGADALDPEYLKCDHLIYLYKGNTDTIFTAGPLTAVSEMSCSAGRTEPSYQNAFELEVTIPDGSDPYMFDSERNWPNPINVLGELLASAKSSGRLFEIASFNSEENGDFLPTSAKAVIVVDDNNVEPFQKRFEQSLEALEEKFKEMQAEDTKAHENDPAAEEKLSTGSFTMKPVDVPKRVLKQTAGNNIISLMFTLQTGIHQQDEGNGAIFSASYIRSVSTAKGKFTLEMDMRSRDEESMKEMSDSYLITSGLCDVDYHEGEASRLWSADENSDLAAYFTSRIDPEGIADTIRLQNSECDVLYAANPGMDMIAYRYDKDHRADTMKNLLGYMTELAKKK